MGRLLGTGWVRAGFPGLVAGGLLSACTSVGAQLNEPLLPLPAQPAQDPRRVALGRLLFHDVRLSSDNSVSCVSCHRPDHGGADPRAFSVGAQGARAAVNTPSVWSAGLNFRQLWAGGAATLEDVVHGVVQNPQVFHSSWSQVLGKLGQDEHLAGVFKAAYPQGLSAGTVSDALAVYTRSLVAPSRFDRYLRGEVRAITPDERRGYERFKAYGCVGCHQGVNVGGNMFQRFGVMGDYFKARASAGRPLTAADMGRFRLTGQEEDRFVFKVPSLRNVARTPPYFHDASAGTLEEAVGVMFRYQLGRKAPPDDKALIVKFLKTLDSEVAQ